MENVKAKRLRGKSKKKPSVFVKSSKIKIKAKKTEYVVVLDKNGNLPSAYPILEFEITNGPPNHSIDIQVARRYPNLLIGGPGLSNFWDKSKLSKDRLWQRAFSSWANGETAIRLDGSGSAHYKMPLEWWRDLARLPWRKFVETKIYYRVLAFPNSSVTKINMSNSDEHISSISHVTVKNNLVGFRVYKLRYHKDVSIPGMWRRYARIEFKVHESHRTDMYNMVQWKKGGRTWEDGTYVFGVMDYGVKHSSKYPEWQIDRVNKNPRYWDGIPTTKNQDSNLDEKTAYYIDDVSCGPPYGGHSQVDCRIDFISKLHLDFEIPLVVTVDKMTFIPNSVDADIIKGTIDEDKCLVLGEIPWSANMSVSVDSNGIFTWQNL